MNIEICKKWRRNLYDGLDGCMACPEELNGINNYGWIFINGLKIYINLCDECLKKPLKKK